MGTSRKIVSVLILLAFLAPLGSVAGETETSIDATVEFEQIHVMKLTMDMVFSGDDTATYRMMMDTDSDGTVSAAEVEAFEAQMNEDPEEMDWNMTLDTKEATSVVQEMSIEGAEGANDSTADITFRTVVTATYPAPAEADTHTYGWPEGEGLAGDDDSDPWEDMASFTYKFICPDGWVFDTEGWPEGASDFLSSDKTTFTVGPSKPANFDTTVGEIDALVIKKKDTGGGDDDDSPGFGLLIALVAVTVAALAVRRR